MPTSRATLGTGPRACFDTIPKDRLLALVAGKVPDRRVLALVGAFLGQRVLEGAREWTPEQGTPQGTAISPLLSNIYLDPLDHMMAGSGSRWCALRTTSWCCAEARKTLPGRWLRCRTGRRKPD